MDLTTIIEGLARPEAYPHDAADLRVLQTHISVVALAGPYAYKVKKPVDLGFLDFTTLEKRLHYCHEEVRLNRRLAPDAYLGVVRVDEIGGRLRVSEEICRPPEDSGSPPEGEGSRGGDAPAEPPAHDYAVKMQRLPEGHTLRAWLSEGALRPYHVAVLARRVARFHADADSGPEVARWGRFDVVAGNARENLEQTREHVGLTLSPAMETRLTEALERELARLRSLMEARASAGVPRDTHGDLHLDHVYLFPEHEPPRDLVIIDCIEFNERFRFADPVADMAFLAMDLSFHGRRDLARVFSDAYFEAAEDPEGRRLLGFYMAYRAAVRGKVGGITALDTEVSGTDRARAIARARALWLVALSELEPPARRPCLVLIGGLPGTGKSTLAEALAERARLEKVASDVTRKRLAGLDPETSADAEFGQGIYTPEWNDRTYDALFEEAERRLLDGGRVIVDASFREESRRARFLDLARKLGVTGLFLELNAPREVIHRRLSERSGGASDADWEIYEGAEKSWEAPSAATAERLGRVETSQSKGWSVEQALAHLSEAELLG